MSSTNQQRTKYLSKGPIVSSVVEGAGTPGLVSVLIPTYNRAYILDKAIQSVLDQTYDRIEVIVVDDGSTDNTAEVLARFGPRVRSIFQTNAGLAVARNTGIAAAKGEFIAFQDSDDLWLPWKLAAQVEVMQRNPTVGLVWTDMVAVTPSGERIRDRHLRTMYDGYGKSDIEKCLPVVARMQDLVIQCPAEYRADAIRVGNIADAMFIGNLVHPPTALMRRSCIAKVGGLDLSFAWTCEDYEFFNRLAMISDCALIDSPGMLYRVDANDQLTNPALMLYIARGNLEFIKRNRAAVMRRNTLDSKVIRNHLANAHAWTGMEELDAPDGSRWRALEHLATSLALNPFQPRILAMMIAGTMLPGPMLDGTRQTISALRKRLQHALNCV